MSSKTVTDSAPMETWHAPELAPSQVRADEPRFARAVGIVSAVLVALGTTSLLVNAGGRASRIISPNWGTFFLVIGLAGLLFHAARDGELQFRRTYGLIGFAWLVFGIIVAAIPMKGPAGSLFLPYGVPSLALALLFLMPFVRHETEAKWRQSGTIALGVAGFLLAVICFIGGNISENFLLPYSLVLGFLGIGYLWAFVVLEGADSELGYRTSLGIGCIGAIALLVALGRTILPPLFFSWHWLGSRPTPYFIPAGMLLTGLALVYICLSIGFTSDNRLVVLTRRELAAFFFSPIAYVVLFGMTLVGGWLYYQFTAPLVSFVMRFEGPSGIPEPILLGYFISWWSILSVILVVPVLTMRLLSEERRSGTLEVLLTAPVSESSIVISKFIATFVIFMLSVLPWGLFLIALRVEGGQPFEYRPLIGFFIAMTASGAAFISMGLFFSSLTRNQIASALLSTVGMLGMTVIFFVGREVEQSAATSIWGTVLKHMSYIDLWWTSTEGLMAPQMLVFHLSAAVFWLFLTTKVLEARKWL